METIVGNKKESYECLLTNRNCIPTAECDQHIKRETRVVCLPSRDEDQGKAIVSRIVCPHQKESSIRFPSPSEKVKGPWII